MGRRLQSFRSPEGPLDARHSGTTVRMKTGVLAAQPLDTQPVAFAAFRLVSVAAVPESVVTFENVGRNPTRSALIGVLRKSAADVDPRERANAAGEPIGTIIVTGDRTGSIHIQPHEVPELIDERHALAARAAHSGEVRVDGARQLRVKVSDCNYPGFFETLDRLVA